MVKCKFLIFLPQSAILFNITAYDQLNQSISSPKLAVIIVIDQFAYDYIPKLSPFLQGGIKKLLNNGIVYNFATYPHAAPGTAVGHAGLATGSYAKDHGWDIKRMV